MSSTHAPTHVVAESPGIRPTHRTFSAYKTGGSTMTSWTAPPRPHSSSVGAVIASTGQFRCLTSGNLLGHRIQRLPTANHWAFINRHTSGEGSVGAMRRQDESRRDPRQSARPLPPWSTVVRSPLLDQLPYSSRREKRPPVQHQWNRGEIVPRNVDSGTVLITRNIPQLAQP